MENINFSLQDVINITANLLGAQPTDLIEKIGENDLTSADQVTSFLKPFAVKRYNDLRDESLNKGFRQASKRTEKLWAEVFNEDITGQKIEDLFISHRDKYAKEKPAAEKSNNITLQKALQSNEVKNYIDGLKATANEAEKIKADFNAFKNLQAIKADALNVLTQNGANFSNNPQIKARQMAALESELKNLKFTRNKNGEITIIDDDGAPLFNKETAQNWAFNDYIKTLSPVDFLEPTPKKENKNTFVPSEKGQNGNAHGFTKNQLSALGYEDFKRALSSGDTEKANFIQQQMIINHESNINK
jgi:hypothetical protein